MARIGLSGAITCQQCDWLVSDPDPNAITYAVVQMHVLENFGHQVLYEVIVQDAASVVIPGREPKVIDGKGRCLRDYALGADRGD